MTDREKLIDLIGKKQSFGIDCQDVAFGKEVTNRELAEYLTANGVTVQKHGWWELHGNDDDMGCSFFCSECGWNFDEDEIYDCSGVVKRELPKYCPYCGAKMDGD